MAIQFQCPSCQATIRVPDAAAGKKGTCPRCNEKLLVPSVGAEKADSPPAKVRPVRQPSPTSGLPQLDPLDGGPNVADSPTETVAAKSSTGLPPLSTARSSKPPSEAPLGSRARSRRGQGGWIVPVVCILIVAAFIGWFTWKSQPRLEGELVATAVRNADLEPGLIPSAFSGLEQDELAEVLDELKNTPLNWGSPNMKFTLFGSANGVKVSIRNGQTSHFVSVSPSQNPVLVNYIKEHAEELSKPREAMLEKHAPEFFAACKKYVDEKLPIKDQLKFRDDVLLPSLVSGLGYHVEASVNGKKYPCVAEDSAGMLYFLLPNATKSFEIVGKEVPEGPRVPANFTVKMNSTSRSSSTSKKSRSKTAAEREAENQGMNPALDDLGEEDKSQIDDMDAGSPPTDEMPAKPKPATKKKPSMTTDEGTMDDEMPAKSLPKKKRTRAASK